MTRSISVIAYHRPEYLRRCLESLGDARGLRDWTVMISIDGPNHRPDGLRDQTRDVALDWQDRMAHGSHEDIRVTMQCHHLGIYDGWEKGAPRTDHPSMAIQEAFDAGSQLHLYIEEDVLAAPDALEWLDSVEGRFGAAPGCWLLNLADHESSRERIAGWHTASRIASPWAWATSADKWNAHIRPGWNANRDHPRRGWDWSLSDQMAAAGAYSLAPNWARAYNIGREGGVHGGSEWYDTHLAGMAWTGPGAARQGGG